MIGGAAPSRRGVAHWPGEGSDSRIIFTAGRRLVALDASTGRPRTFGNDGEVDMVVPYNSAPLIHRHVVVVPRDIPGGGVHGDQSAPWRFLAGPALAADLRVERSASRGYFLVRHG